MLDCIHQPVANSICLLFGAKQVVNNRFITVLIKFVGQKAKKKKRSERFKADKETAELKMIL